MPPSLLPKSKRLKSEVPKVNLLFPNGINIEAGASRAIIPLKGVFVFGSKNGFSALEKAPITLANPICQPECS